MEKHSGINKLQVSEKELNRQFRVLKQSLSIHTMLKDRYMRHALIIDIMLLACSVIFCATTFASDNVFNQIGLSTQKVRFILGTASIVAFFSSLVALRVGWKGKAALHREAEQKLTTVLALFRKLRSEDGSWPHDQTEELHRAYWGAMNNVIEIPGRRFVGLKSRHLRKVKISEMLDSAPGCPVFVLRMVLLYRSFKKVFGKKTSDENQTGRE